MGDSHIAGKLCTGYSGRSAAILKESKAFCEGQLARQQGKLITDNPHPDGNAEDSWAVGWFLVDQLAPIGAGVKIACCAALGEITGTPTPIIARWDDSIPNVDVPQGGTWDIELIDSIVIGSGPITFAIDISSLPTGITLNADGTFSGTVTNLAGQGQLNFIATNAAGDSLPSPFLNWTIPS